MNFIKRGFLGIVRRLGKSFILLASIFILGTLMSSAMAIQLATGNVESVIKDRLGAEVRIEVDYEALDQLSEEERATLDRRKVSVDTIKEIGEISYVKYFDFNTNLTLESKDFKSFEEEHQTIAGGRKFSLRGVNYAPVIDIEEDKVKLVEGRVFKQEEVDHGTSVALISKNVAKLNDLHVGDHFTLDNSFNYNRGEKEVETPREVVLEIIGLFDPQITAAELEEHMAAGGGMDLDIMSMELQNRLYVPNEVVTSEDRFTWEEYLKTDEELAALIDPENTDLDNYFPIYVLKNAMDTDAFVEEASPLLPEYHTMISATDHYDNISGPMETMSDLARYVLLATIFATILIAGLVVLLFLRDRKHELGIYLSLGEQRSRVIGQILIEVMLVAVIGITISLFSGTFLAGQISETMIQADGPTDPSHEVIFDRELLANVSAEDVIDAYEVKLSSVYILGFLGVGLLTILISTIIPLIYMLRLNPKKILMS